MRLRANLFCVSLLLAGLMGFMPTGESAMIKKASFAAGCFWGVEKIFMQVPGVVDAQVGYAGGATQNPTYEEVCSGRTGHTETVEISYDSEKVSYEKLLLTFWQYHDPTTKDQQGPDIGSQYRSVVFYHDETQKKIAEESISLLNESGILKKDIVTEVIPAEKFWDAEEYHQDYLVKNPNGYCSHHFQSDKIAEVLSPLMG